MRLWRHEPVANNAREPSEIRRDVFRTGKALGTKRFQYRKGEGIGSVLDNLGWDILVRVDYRFKGRSDTNLSRHTQVCRHCPWAERMKGRSICRTVFIEATEEPGYFGFYSSDLKGFSGIGHSVEDCIYKAR